MGTKLIIQIPFRDHARKVYENLEIRYPGDWEVVHGTESDTYGVMIDFRKWYYKNYPYLTLGDGLKPITGFSLQDHQFLEYSEKENLTVEVDYSELMSKASYVDFGCGIEFNLESRVLWYFRDIPVKKCILAKDNSFAMSIYDKDRRFLYKPGVAEALKKIKRRDLLFFEELEWKKYVGLPDF